MGFIGTNDDAIHEKLRFLQNGNYHDRHSLGVILDCGISSPVAYRLLFLINFSAFSQGKIFQMLDQN
jgi:hypothetical protein